MLFIMNILLAQITYDASMAQHTTKICIFAQLGTILTEFKDTVPHVEHDKHKYTCRGLPGDDRNTNNLPHMNDKLCMRESRQPKINARLVGAWLVPTGRALMCEEQGILHPIPAATEISTTPPI